MNASATHPAAWTDLSGLRSITLQGRSDRAGALQAVARQFESFFVSQMLAGMRAANEVLADGNPFNSGEMQFRQELLDRQLSVSLTQGRGIGLGEMLARQLQRQFGAEAPAVVPGGTGSTEEQLAKRRIDGAPARALASVPAGVGNALRVLEPMARKVGRRVAQGLFAGKEAFVRAVLPDARRAARALGVDHRVLIAQSALETGWGQSILSDHAGRCSNNLFNIKAGSYWQGPSVGVRTLEYVQGLPQPQHARFRAYGSFADSFADYVDLLRSQPRYAAALANADDATRFMRSLAQAGYATDPDYAAKVLELMRDVTIAEAD